MMGIKDAINNLIGLPVMSGKPEDIPQNIWDETTEYVKAYLGENGEINQTPHELAARAVMAERERCAKVCDAFVQAYDEEIASLGLVQPRRGSPAKYAVKSIAADIRGGSNG